MEAIADARDEHGNLRWGYRSGVFDKKTGRAQRSGYTSEQFFNYRARKDMERSSILGDDASGAKVNPLGNMSSRPTGQSLKVRVDLWKAMEEEKYLDEGVPADDYGQHKYINRGFDWGDEYMDSMSHKPAPITIAPTSTMFPDRPRTVAAGFEIRESDDTGTLTVVFRDGTYYNYYQVPVKVWDGFKMSPSKGRYILNTLDAYPRGYADLSAMDIKVRTLIDIYRAARVAQKWTYRKGTAARKYTEGKSTRSRYVPRNNAKATASKYTSPPKRRKK